MRPYDLAADDLAAAMDTAAAFAARQHEAGHAGKGVVVLEALVSAAAEFGTEADKLAAGPDWEAIAMRMFARFPVKPYEDDFTRRVRAHLDSPSMRARAALPIEQRRAIAQITSFHLPDHGQQI